jgi:hypothetical protein
MFSLQNDAEFHAITSDVLTASKSNTTTFIINLFPERCHFPYVFAHYRFPLTGSRN